MKTNWIKILCLTLSLVMLLGMVVACAPSEEDTPNADGTTNDGTIIYHKTQEYDAQGNTTDRDEVTDTLGRMHGDAQFAGSSSVPAHVEMMGLIGAGNNPMVGMTVAVAVAIEEASK